MKHNRITRQDYCSEIGITAKQFNERLAKAGILEAYEWETWRSNAGAFSRTNRTRYRPQGWVVERGYHQGKMILWSKGSRAGTWEKRNWQWLRDYLDSVFKPA